MDENEGPEVTDEEWNPGSIGNAAGAELEAPIPPWNPDALGNKSGDDEDGSDTPDGHSDGDDEPDAA